MDFLLPPSDKVYVSFNQLLEYLNEHSAKQRYAVTIKPSKKNKKQELRKVWLQCDKGREYKGRGKDIRQTSSRRDECLWKALATRETGLETETFQMDNPEHNHLPTFPGAHSTHQEKAMTDNAQMTIISQMQVNSSA